MIITYDTFADTKVYIFNEEEKELLNLDLSSIENPCFKCSNTVMGSCCGCRKHDKWEKRVKAYKDLKILDVAMELISLREEMKRYEKIQKEMEIKKERLKTLEEAISEEAISA